MQWMIYGATGYTGRLVVAEAIRRGHRPIIAGRSAEKLRHLSQEFDLDYVAFTLDDMGTIAEAIADMDLVYHAAGPFIHTSDPMLRACLATNTHYLDLTGHLAVFEHTYTFDEAARRNGIALISGVGFDVIPTDCLANYVSQKAPSATHLELGVMGFYGSSAGTAKASLEIIADGGLARKNGQLTRVPLAGRTRSIRFADGEKHATMSIPWGDLAAVYRSTRIPNISTYMAIPAPLIPLIKVVAPLGTLAFKSRLIKNALSALIDLTMTGPDEQARQTGKSYIWAQAMSANGHTAQAWLETLEPYEFTAKAGILAIERTLESSPIGALTPAQAFGADFVLSVPGTRRFDTL